MVPPGSRRPRRALVGALLTAMAVFHANGHHALADTGGRPSVTDRALTAADGAAIERVIRDQMAAFGRDDGPAAFAHAAPGIQRMFGDPGIFLEMVRQAYPEVYRAENPTFAPARIEDGTVVQEVLLRDETGGRKLAVYQLERQPDGTWRISGCVLLSPPGLEI